ncbi:hypothetical protein [Shewanella xiamenensis]|uniref:Uncharacterized protein n=1 Tax=Shewanella xiamenensis TaxID=332186 RepID=A0ABT6UGW0_9GAMM|nr:hypothetical protein [Shewanella xiamenensis]MCR4535552.1 hypothetical protein [Shewanella xiamenensis]MDI5833707.1 hypothetical protein [Shewanella xiamenensis]
MRLLIKNTLLAAVAMFLTSQAIAEDKRWTLEEAVKSHQQNVGERASKGVDHNKGLADWNSISRVPPPLTSGGNNKVERQYTLLWQAPTTAGLNAGNITLSKSFREFDEIVSIGSMDDGRYVQHYRFTPAEYDAAVVLRNGYATLFERDSVSWWGRFTSDTYFTTMGENSRLYEIYGVKFGSGGTQKVCAPGQTQSKYTYCTGANQQTCEQGEERQTCSALGFWGAWQTITLPSCITGTQQCR